MNKILNKSLGIIQLWWNALMIGMKNTEDMVFTQSGASGQDGTSVTQEKDVQRVSHALLRGELTQEVKELRYRTYLVDRESKHYKYYAPTLAVKREKNDNKFITYDRTDGYDPITVQYNHPISEDILDGIQQVVDGDGHGKTQQYNIRIKRNFIPRFRLEAFLQKVVVKKIPDNETHAGLDLYFSKYPENLFHTSDDTSFRSKAFIHELERVKRGEGKSEVFSFNSLGFVTSHAWGKDDLLEYEFDNIIFKEIVEFDGNYVVRFKAHIAKNGYDLTDAFYDKTMAEKYANKEEKADLTATFTIPEPISYKCEECGKTVIYDVVEMDEIPIIQAREIDDNDVESVTNVTEYMDIQIIEQTIGKKLCKECLRKYIDKRDKDINELR